MADSGFHHHDHFKCVEDALQALQKHCLAEGLKFTPLRKRVFEILLEEHKALGAYDILARLREEGFSAQPPVAYRHLDFLVAHGFAHKIERLNAFIACTHIGAVHDPAFLICRECRTVSETMSDSSILALHHKASDADFQIEDSVVEAIGTCLDCRQTDARQMPDKNSQG